MVFAAEYGVRRTSLSSPRRTFWGIWKTAYMTDCTEHYMGVHADIPRIVLDCRKDKQQTVPETIAKGVRDCILGLHHSLN